MAAPADIFHDGVPKWSPEESPVTVDVRGRLQYDIADGDQDFALPSDSVGESEIRAARFGADITAGAAKVTVELDFVDDDVQAADLLLAVGVSDRLTLTAGHFKEAVSMEEITSSRFISFMERGSFTDAFDLSRRVGASAALSGANWTWTTAVQGGRMDGLDVMSDGVSVSSRATFAPVLEDARYVHLGASGRWRDHGDGADPLFRYAQRPLAHLAPRTVSTARFADSDTMLGLEAAWGQGPLHAEAEYAWLSADGPAADADFSGFYLSGGWFLTGEHRTYEAGAGKFDRTRPLRPLGKGGFGALELMVRYDALDLNDGAIAGGDMSNWTLGANWYPTARTRITANYVDSDVDGGVYGDGSSEIFQMRFQIDW